ncbi:response regulator [Cognataquiflexum aquatile]|jgi:CheY-like chemotaxis protein|uniref:response regulator n=1 Tax=Cognataquiflexum aquatile TaxID=2249427 RepID=UPI000DE9B705|nr:response regulator [Cognataquiflexum aquatile]
MTKPINKLIFVDDDKIQHMINRKNILRINPEIDLLFFENPFEALGWLKDNDTDLLILDVNMPEMQGWDFLDELNKMNKKVPVKMLTSSMDPMDVEKSHRYPQVSGFLVKPLSNEVLTEILGT